MRKDRLSENILSNLSTIKESNIIDGIKVRDFTDEEYPADWSQEMYPIYFVAKLVAERLEDEDKIDTDILKKVIRDVYVFAGSKDKEIDDYISKKLKEVNMCNHSGKGIKEAAETKREFEVFIEEVVSEEFTVEAVDMEDAANQMIEKYNSGNVVLEPGNLVSKSIMTRDPETGEETSWNEF